MGNSLPHLLTDEDLDNAVRGFAKLLNRGGRIALQLLNYARVIHRRDRIVSIDRSQGKEYIRFYDFMDNEELVRFNVLTVTGEGANCDHNLESVMLRPYQHDQVAGALRNTGLTNIRLYGDLALTPFDVNESATLLVVACHSPRGC